MTAQPLHQALLNSFSNIEALSIDNNRTFKAYDARLQQQVLLKLFSIISSSSLNQKYDNEKSHLQSLSHPNIIQLLNAVDTTPTTTDSSEEQSSYLVLEYASFGDLLGVVEDNGAMNEILARTVFHQLIDGLSYLHSMNVAHMDIKMDNLVMTEDYTIKVTDFDLSQPLDSTELRGQGTMGYRAPEIKAGLCQDLRAVDIYSAGVVLFILLAGHNPYSEISSGVGLQYDKLYKTLRRNQTRFWDMHCNYLGNDNLFSGAFKEMVERLLAEDPMMRPTIEEIKEMEWYKGEILEGYSYVAEMKKYTQNKE